MDSILFKGLPQKKLDGGLGRVKPKYFVGPGMDFSLVAFLVLWLSRYVVDWRSLDGVNVQVLRLATLLAHGRCVASIDLLRPPATLVEAPTDLPDFRRSFLYFQRRQTKALQP